MEEQTGTLGVQSTVNLTITLRDDDTGLEVRKTLQVFDRERPEVVVLKELAGGMRDMLKAIGIITEKGQKK